MGARGGIYVAGGIMPRLQDAFAQCGVREKFEREGHYGGDTAAIPTCLVPEDISAFRGLAAILDGRMLNPA